MLVELHLVVCHVMWLLRIQVLLHVLQERRLSASQCLWSGPVLCCVYAHCSAGIPTGTCWIELQEMQFATKYPPTRPPVFIASWNTHKGDQPPSEAVVPEAQWRTEVTGHRPDFKRPPTTWFVVIWYEKLHLITKSFSERVHKNLFLIYMWSQSKPPGAGWLEHSLILRSRSIQVDPTASSHQTFCPWISDWWLSFALFAFWLNSLSVSLWGLIKSSSVLQPAEFWTASAGAAARKSVLFFVKRLRVSRKVQCVLLLLLLHLLLLLLIIIIIE